MDATTTSTDAERRHGDMMRHLFGETFGLGAPSEVDIAQMSGAQAEQTFVSPAVVDTVVTVESGPVEINGDGTHEAVLLVKEKRDEGEQSTQYRVRVRAKRTDEGSSEDESNYAAVAAVQFADDKPGQFWPLWFRDSLTDGPLGESETFVTIAEPSADPSQRLSHAFENAPQGLTDVKAYERVARHVAQALQRHGGIASGEQAAHWNDVFGHYRNAYVALDKARHALRALKLDTAKVDVAFDRIVQLAREFFTEGGCSPLRSSSVGSVLLIVTDRSPVGEPVRADDPGAGYTAELVDVQTVAAERAGPVAPLPAAGAAGVPSNPLVRAEEGWILA